MRTRQRILLASLNWHKKLAWLGGIALVIFGLSALTHPLMTWTGPQTAAFFPPQAIMQAEQLAAIPSILKRHDIKKAAIVKLLPTSQGVMLQVTESRTAPRRYFRLDTGEEMINYDGQQAVWLARYYTGEQNAGVASVTFQTEFDHAYPWVNRLLPVYRVEFATADHLTTFIYTETSALGNVTNDWKTGLQAIFRILHTWSWLEAWEYARVAVMSLLLLCLMGMAVIGFSLILLMKKRRIYETRRRMHRLLAYIVWLPLLGFSTSGLYHLLYQSVSYPQSGLQLGEPLALENLPTHMNGKALDIYVDTPLNGISLVTGDGGALFYRLSFPQGKPSHTIARNARFDGVPTEKPAVYLDAITGHTTPMTDKVIAEHLAIRYAGTKPDALERVDHFNMHYDFRNKRLPIWQADYNGDLLFVDPATGVLADIRPSAGRYEAYSFSFLHKWNFLAPLTGREIRDTLVVMVLLLALSLAFFGIALLVRLRMQKSKNRM